MSFFDVFVEFAFRFKGLESEADIFQKRPMSNKIKSLGSEAGLHLLAGRSHGSALTQGYPMNPGDSITAMPAHVKLQVRQ